MRSPHHGVWELGGGIPEHGEAAEENGPSIILEDIRVVLIVVVSLSLLLDLVGQPVAQDVGNGQEHKQCGNGPGGVEELVEVVFLESVVGEYPWRLVVSTNLDCLKPDVPLLIHKSN